MISYSWQEDEGLGKKINEGFPSNSSAFHRRGSNGIFSANERRGGQHRQMEKDSEISRVTIGQSSLESGVKSLCVEILKLILNRYFYLLLESNEKNSRYWTAP